jgi:AcrR family transcriptional regulator
MAERVRDRVFFEIPTRLPRGRHDLSRAQVLAAQRERLMIAITELLAERGYLAVGVREIAERAGVSRAAFYECFADKQECVFAAYDRFVSVLEARMAATVTPDGGADVFVPSMLAAYLGALQEDVVVARAFQVEMDALGREARSRRRSSARRLAEFVRASRERVFGEEPSLSLGSYLAVVHAVREAACDLLDEQAEPDLLALVPQLTGWVARVLRPTASCRAQPAGRQLASAEQRGDPLPRLDEPEPVEQLLGDA